MSRLARHLRGDPAALERELRDAERRHDVVVGDEICRALEEHRAWGPILRYAERLVRQAEPSLDRVIPGTPPPWNPTIFHTLTGDAHLARYGFNAASLTLRWSGDAIAPEPGGAPEVVPNPLPLCVRALRVWWPGGWLRLIGEMVVSAPFAWRTDGTGLAIEVGEGESRHLIHHTGRMECGIRAPQLKPLPPCVCLSVSEGRQGVCPVCLGKPSEVGEMCVCVAGRCPRCGTSPKFTRANKWVVISAYGSRLAE